MVNLTLQTHYLLPFLVARPLYFLQPAQLLLGLLPHDLVLSQLLVIRRWYRCTNNRLVLNLILDCLVLLPLINRRFSNGVVGIDLQRIHILLIRLKLRLLRPLRTKLLYLHCLLRRRPRKLPLPFLFFTLLLIPDFSHHRTSAPLV